MNTPLQNVYHFNTQTHIAQGLIDLLSSEDKSFSVNDRWIIASVVGMILSFVCYSCGLCMKSCARKKQNQHFHAKLSDLNAERAYKNKDIHWIVDERRNRATYLKLLKGNPHNGTMVKQEEKSTKKKKQRQEKQTQQRRKTSTESARETERASVSINLETDVTERQQQVELEVNGNAYD